MEERHTERIPNACTPKNSHKLIKAFSTSKNFPCYADPNHNPSSCALDRLLATFKMSKLWERDPESQDPLLSPEGKDQFQQLQYAKKSQKFLFIFTFLIGVAISSLLWGLATIKTWRPPVAPPSIVPLLNHIPQTPHLTSCGQNSTAAKALGCQFQLWMYAWVPPPCVDEEIEQEYLAVRDWGYYLDKEGKHEVDVSMAASGEHVIWTTWGQHYWHCFFTVKKLVRSVAINGSGVGFTEADVGPGNTHMDHCLQSMLDKDLHPWDEIMDEMYANYGGCYMNGVGDWDPVKWELSSHPELQDG